MAEITHKVPKSLVDNETQAWGMVCRKQDCNSDMIVRTEHTDEDYVYVVDKDVQE